jgi:hypothetical protein
MEADEVIEDLMTPYALVSKGVPRINDQGRITFF